jgi:hypothetical protein
VADLDNDGRLDFIANNLGREPEVFQNVNESENGFISLRLEGTKSNRDGIGATVAVTAGGRTQRIRCKQTLDR